MTRPLISGSPGFGLASLGIDGAPSLRECRRMMPSVMDEFPRSVSVDLLPGAIFTPPPGSYPARLETLPAWRRPLPRATDAKAPAKKTLAKVGRGERRSRKGGRLKANAQLRIGRRPTRKQGRKHAVLGSGTIVGKYRIEEFLGSGSFAAVYRASHMALRAPFSLKILHQEVLRKKPRLSRMLCDEARFAAPIHHPNLIRVIDLHESDELAYIVLEYVEGQSLADMIRERKRIDPALSLEIGIQTCKGLRAALEHGIVHRDIKPANILYTRSEQVKVIDLGLAQRKDPLESIGDRKSSSGVVGTPAYMAPEQADRPEITDFRSDLYALGSTLFHAMVGSPPFPGKRGKALLEAKQAELVLDPVDIGVSLPVSALRLLARFMRPSMEERPSSYGEAIRMMKTVLDELE